MFVGIDKHEKDCHATVFDQTGTRCDRYVFPNSQRGWKKFCNRTPAGSHVAFEASSGCGPVYDLLVEHGYKVQLRTLTKLALFGKTSRRLTNVTVKRLLSFSEQVFFLRSQFTTGQLVPTSSFFVNGWH